MFSFYVLVSLVLLFLDNPYHHSVYLSSANVVSSAVYSSVSDVTGYFHLKGINESLQANNARLENEVLNLKYEIAKLKTRLTDSVVKDWDSYRYDYISATVINNNVNHPRNYFSINKGKEDGVLPGMGIVDQNGIVGIVNVAGDHSARAISLLNETQHFSVKIKDSDYVGTLSWKGKNPEIAYVEEIPRHAEYQIGDTIVTSGYSMTFPEGIPVGTILNRVRGSDDNFFIFKIKLNSNFRALSTVRVIKDDFSSELDSLQKYDVLQ